LSLIDVTGPVDELSLVYGRLSGLVLCEETVDSGLRLLTSLTTETVVGAVGAGVTVLDESGRRVTAAASDELIRKADGLQYELEEGPCLVALADRVVVRVDDVAAGERWPHWSQAVRSVGVRASLSVPVVAGDRTLGALKVYASRPAVFGPDAERRLTMFAAQAAILLANACSREAAGRYSVELVDALRTRDAINVAKGIVMAQEGVTEEAALALLTARSRGESRTLRDAAEAVLRSAVRGRH
jgi:GAF domain-containing protein